MSNELTVTGRKLPISEATKRRNPSLFQHIPNKPLGPCDHDECPQDKCVKQKVEARVAQPKKRLRQSSRPLMNKLEQEWYEQIRDQFPNYPPIRIQAKRYRLGNGINYKPDFTCSSWPNENEQRHTKGYARETAWEVKGPHAFRGGFENLKVAAAQWPEVRFILVFKDENGSWCQQEILP